MILFFSGTGNSEYVAERIGKDIGDTVLNLFDKIRKKDYSALQSDKPWIVVTPTYAWRIPRIVTDWLRKTELIGSRDIYFVLTCGGDIGNAGAFLRRFCMEKDWRIGDVRRFSCLKIILHFLRRLPKKRHLH